MIDKAVKGLLALGAFAIGFAAADTYVVVLALPEMMLASGLGVDELQKAAPIVSGFLLGYVAVLPLIGRIADLRGRVPVLIGCLVIFAFGSLVTAAGHDLLTIVAGRFVQGVGGGGLIPPVLALIADVWPPNRRGLPLGVVGAVQELGAVIGPLYGAVILAFGTWRDIFWLNMGVGILIAAAMLKFRAAEPREPEIVARPSRDGFSVGLLTVLWLVIGLWLLEPESLVSGVNTGLVFLPLIGQNSLTSPLALTVGVLVLLLIWRLLTAAEPAIDYQAWRNVAARIDILGALALTAGLACIVLTFATADHENAGISPQAIFLVPAGVVSFGIFIWRQRVAPEPLVSRGALAERAAWGSVLVSGFVGAALIAALVDIPFFARLTIHQDSQLGAALVLVRFLVALPVGALLGGFLLRYFSPALITCVAMLLSAGAFYAMTSWTADSLHGNSTSAVLIAAGLGFGLAVAPVNDALLAATAEEVHGLASALLIVARMVGMLVGISALTTLGLEAFRRAVSRLPTVEELCGGSSTACPAYGAAMRDAGIAQLQAVFFGAMVSALIAAVLAAILLRRPRNVKP